MSRRKQAFPVRVEGSRPPLSVEPGSSLTQKSEESSSNSILQDEYNSNIPTEVAHFRPPNTLSSGEFIITSTVCDEPKTNVFACEEQSFPKYETEPQVILPYVKVERSVIHNEQDPLIVTTCSDSSVVVKEQGLCTFPVDEKNEYENVINMKEQKPLCPSHNHHSQCCCKEVEKNAEERVDLNIRTTFTCTDGTEIKIVQNCRAEKAEVQCVTNLAESTFEIRKKQLQQITGSLHENHASEMKNQVQFSTELEKLENKETPLQAILPCVEVDPSLSAEPEPLIISSSSDSIPIIKDTNLSAFPFDERKRCEMIINVLEPDSSTILLDEYDANNPVEVSHARSPNTGETHSNGELIVTNDVYDEPKPSVFAHDEYSFLKNEAKSQYLLSSIKIEPNVILDEGQDSLIISDCNDTSCVVKEEDLCTTFSVGEKKQNAINMEELKSCLSQSCARDGHKEVEKNAGECGDWDVKTSQMYKAGTEVNITQSSCAEEEEVQSVTKRRGKRRKSRKRQIHKIKRSLRKRHSPETKEQVQASIEHENFFDSEETQLHAILPCVDVDPGLFKEEQEKVTNVPEVNPLCISHNNAHYGRKEVEQNAEMGRDLNAMTSVMCKTATETKLTQNLRARREKVQSATKLTESTCKVRRKQLRKTKRSFQKSRAPKIKTRSQPCTEHENLSKTEGTHLQAILPCVEVDPSLLNEEEVEELVTGPSHKHSIPITTEKFISTFSTDKKKRCEKKIDTQKSVQMCLQSNHVQHDYEEVSENSEVSDESTVSDFESHIPGTRASEALKSCVTDEELRCMVDFTKEALGDREKKLQQIREAVYKKRALETDEQKQARLEKDKLRQRKRRAEETEEQREKRLLTMRLHKRIKRSMHSSAGLQKNFLDYYMEEMFRYPETQEEQGSPLNMIVSIDPSWVVRTVEKQQFKCTVETEEQRKSRLEKDMMRQRKKRAEESEEQRAKRLETMRINKRIRRAMETEDQRHRRLEYSRERQLYRRLNETEEQRKQRLEREKLRQREKRATESSEERSLRLQAARERMRMRLSGSSKDSDIFDNLLSSDSFSS